MLGPLKTWYFQKEPDHTCGYRLQMVSHFLSIYFRTYTTHCIGKENLANNSHLSCDLDLKYKTQPNNLLISVTNTYAESVFFI